MPCHFTNLTSISTLSLGINFLSGTISSFIGNLTQLQFLDLSGNKFEGVLPPSMEHLHSLDTLYLDTNLLSGEVPAFMLRFPALVVLDLSFNKLSGSVPKSLYTSTNSALQYLKLSRNNLTGSISESLSRLTALQVLRLNGNGLTGPVPESLSLLSKLETLDLSSNNLEGSLPLAMRDMKSLLILSVGVNPNMRGSFPTCLKHLEQLVVLDLRSTKLEGEIPLWVGERLQQLQILILSDNLLTSKIPAHFGGLTGMKQPGVGASAKVIANHGELLYELFISIKGQSRDFYSLANLAVLDLSKNKLWGSIPTELGELGGLISMDLSSNFLNGSIPESLADLSKLESLDLSDNTLEGEIPQQFTDLTFLSYANLSDNYLTGMIPEGGQWGTFNTSSYSNNKGLCISANADLSSQLPYCTAPGPPPLASTTTQDPPSGLSTLSEYISWTAFGVSYPLGVLLVYLFKIFFANWLYLKLWVRRMARRLLKSESITGMPGIAM